MSIFKILIFFLSQAQGPSIPKIKIPRKKNEVSGQTPLKHRATPTTVYI